MTRSSSVQLFGNFRVLSPPGTTSAIPKLTHRASLLHNYTAHNLNFPNSLIPSHSHPMHSRMMEVQHRMTPKKEIKEKEEEVEEGIEENTLKPPPSFNGALSRFIFPAPTQKTHATSIVATQTTFPQKRAVPASKQSREGLAPTSTKPKKKRRKHTGYAPPSTYAHLSGIPDVLSPNLICVFIGFNPGLATAAAGHAYASPTNSFWRLLHSSGCTPDRQLPPAMDEHLPELYSLGRTDLVSRPSRDAAELSKEEMVGAVPELEEKIRKWQPEAVCLVGKAVWEAIWRSKTGKRMKKTDFDWGWQRMKFANGKEWGGCRAFVVPSTSGLVAAYSPEFKRAIWKGLGDWVQERRKERGETAPRSVEI